ncbi:MAG: ABC transporter permease subunit [Planctomycetes bacterium]|nr:ABC transporter permease subunit [Planctomycetota bacterium]
MSWKNIKLIFLREVRDQFRDRRTIFMVAILPLMLYPALGLGMLQMAVLFSEQPRTVVILGAKDLPTRPELKLLDGNRFAAGWFNNPADADKLDVITDLPLDDSQEVDEARRQRIERLLQQAERLREPVAQRRQIKESIARLQRRMLEMEIAQSKARETGDQARVDDLAEQMKQLALQIRELNSRLVPIEHKISELFAECDMDVLLIIPEGFGEKIERMTEELKTGRFRSTNDDYYFGPTPITNRADEKSLIAYNRVQEALENWERKILELRLTDAHLPQSLAMPVNPDPVDVAQEEQIAANLWSKLFPALLVIMAVTGAFYPAVDLAAGEKERGTMETLLILPARRSELVLGKFLTVMLFSVTTALLNLASMGITGRYMMSVAGQGAFDKIGGISFPPPLALMWVLVLLIPLAAFFSALCLALATFARSTKEGQYYLTPLLMVTLGITVFCLSPAIEMSLDNDTSWFYSVMPIMGVALLLKALLLDPGNTEVLVFAVPVLITTVAYSLLALWWAIEQFNSEEVLFRESEKFEVRLWIRHLLRDKEPTPSFAEAGFCFVLIMLLQFASIRFMGNVVRTASPETLGLRMMQALLIQQLVIIASPALFMGVMLTTSPKTTFRLRLPGWRAVGAAVLLALALHPLVVELTARMPFPPLPPEAIRVFRLMGDPRQPLWLVLIAFAAAPAVCEELAFRGFILSGFSRSRHVWLPIVLSSVAFGIMHMFPQQVFYATLLGLVLALIVIRTDSLLPAMAFHFFNNSLSVIRGRLDFGWVMSGPPHWFFRIESGELRYQWPLLLLCALASIVLLRWFVNRRHPIRGKEQPAEPSVRPDTARDSNLASPPVRIG